MLFFWSFFSACLDFDMLQVCPCSLECVNSWKVRKMQEWQLTRQESRRKVETDCFGWDGRNYLSDNDTICLSLGCRKNFIQPAGLGIHRYIMIYIYIFYLLIYLYTYAIMYIYIYTDIYIYTYIYIYVCMYVCMYMIVYVYVYEKTNMRIHRCWSY